MKSSFNFLVWIIFLWASSVEAAVPRVVVTIKPIHSLVTGIMKGVGEPVLLMQGEKSPHMQSLSMEEVELLHSAQVVVWIGPSYETSLRRVVESVKEKCRVLTLIEKPGLLLYPVRQGTLWGAIQEEGEGVIHECPVLPDHLLKDTPAELTDCHGDHTHDPLSTDGHIWLDPHNAQTIVAAIAQDLASLDPQHKEAYLANSQKIIERLQQLDETLQQTLTPVQDKPYLVHHDGTQYFDRHFKTRAVGAFVSDGHHTLNARHLLKIHHYIRQGKIICVFTEPQFSPVKIRDLVKGTSTRIQTLDYLGIELPANEDAYFLMMKTLAQAMISGLGGLK